MIVYGNVSRCVSDTNRTRTRTPLVVEGRVRLEGIEPLWGFYPFPLGMQTAHTDGSANEGVISNR
jgi:hypothetical protein